VSLTDYTPIAFGPGGLIQEDDPVNQELLERIHKTDPLSSETLLKLAAFYTEYPTNKPLGDHLALIALTKLGNDADVYQLLASKTSYAAANSLRDFLEDFWDGGRDESQEPAYIRMPDVWSIPFSGVGLLIETGLQRLEGYYVIGVSPLIEP
jgi:hypothetical protein